MSTQSYYKDRLGFDPREALYDGAPSSQTSTVKSGSRSRTVHHYYSSTTNNGGSPQQYDYQNNNNNISSSNITSNITSNSHSHHSGSPSKRQKQSQGNINNNQGDGYEDALTQFKGMMSLWDYFVENWDITGRKMKCMRKRAPNS